MPSALFNLPTSPAVSDEEQSSGPGSFSGRGWADSMAAGGQVRVRLWAVSRGRRQTVSLCENGSSELGRPTQRCPTSSRVQLKCRGLEAGPPPIHPSCISVGRLGVRRVKLQVAIRLEGPR